MALVYRREGLGGITCRLLDRDNYSEWIRNFDRLTDVSRAIMRQRIDAFANKPLISIIMPVYNSNPKWLREAIASVRNQIYPHWELCIADDSSTDPGIRSILERYALKDERIRVVFRSQNGHICAASNSALELATGEWSTLLDHDDLLSEHALFWVVNTINQHSMARLIYSDEDKLDASGQRHGPYFKCDWNIDLFFSQNMISHLGVYRTDLLKKIGFREGFEGSQDYDIALRYIEFIEPEQIYHIPRVLYHWRVHPDSTAQKTDNKPYAMTSARKALNEYFQRQKISAKVEIESFGYRVRYALPKTPPKVSLIIISEDNPQQTKQCIAGIFAKTSYPDFEVLMASNSADHSETLKYIEDLQSGARIKPLPAEPGLSYAQLNNLGVRLAQGRMVCLFNSNLEVISPDWLREMVSIALQPGVGAVGPKLYYPNDRIQQFGMILGLRGNIAGFAHKGIPKNNLGYGGRAALISGFSALTGDCLIVRKEIYQELGGLNQSTCPTISTTWISVSACGRRATEMSAHPMLNYIAMLIRRIKNRASILCNQRMNSRLRLSI